MKLTGSKFTYTYIALSLLAISFNVAATEIEFQNNSELNVRILGYEGFKEIELLDIAADHNEIITYCIEYKGLALLKFPAGQSYPVYFDTTAFLIIIKDPASSPEFVNSPGNSWLYNWLRTKNPEQLETQRFKGIKLLIKSRLLNESSYEIKSIDALQSKKEEYKLFIKENIQNLFYSDMLIQLCRQYLMMNEYIAYSKQKFKDQINEDVDSWVEMISEYIEPEETTRFILEIFYGRSMVTIAGSILDSNTDMLIKDSAKYQFKKGDQFPDLLVHNASSENTWKLKENKDKKIISVVGEEDVVSKVSTIVLARELDRQNINIPIVIIPTETLTNAFYFMDGMFTGTLYFSQMEMIKEASDYHVYILLDDSNNIILISPKYESIINRITSDI